MRALDRPAKIKCAKAQEATDMGLYKMPDGTVVRTKNARKHWAEERDWDGNNNIGRSSCSQWHDEDLYCSRKGRYYLVHSTRVSGERDWAEWISPEAAAAWLVLNECGLPPDLEAAAELVIE
jgi:hypothetical protein